MANSFAYFYEAIELATNPKPKSHHSVKKIN